MCGICGQHNINDQSPVRLDDIKRMTGSLVHRGPDDEGFYLSGPVGLGFRRLSIIDLDGGHQPMSDQAESVWVVFNGQIYNFGEMRCSIVLMGCSGWRSGTSEKSGCYWPEIRSESSWSTIGLKAIGCTSVL